MKGMQVKTEGLSFLQYTERTFLQLHGKNGFVEVSQTLAKYRSENNFVGPLK